MKKDKKILYGISGMVVLVIIILLSVLVMNPKGENTKALKKEKISEESKVKKKTFDEIQKEAWAEAEKQKAEEEVKKKTQEERIKFEYDEYMQLRPKVIMPKELAQNGAPLSTSSSTIEYLLTVYKKKNNATFTEAVLLSYLGMDENKTKKMYVQVNDENQTIFLITIPINGEEPSCVIPEKSQNEIKEEIAKIGEEGEEIEAIKKNEEARKQVEEKQGVQKQVAQESVEVNPNMEIREATEDLENLLYGDIATCIDSIANFLAKEKDTSSYVTFNNDLVENAPAGENFFFTVTSEKGTKVKVIGKFESFTCEKAQ